MNKTKRLSPQQIMWLISHGREDEIPKSKTWHKFKEFREDNHMSTPKLALEIGISLQTMNKFIAGTFVISPTNIKKIQAFLKDKSL